ncbi:unnamed protein product [Bursaphelenchus okinawaensis]|uniref:Small ribosomal subunit protein mS35 mitochondrial conserved domain-containing protein n=1 Tax=Bursaphelenchus okinawaensis TaxID=465554 RepID=A0A811LA47_9BILA|nr:unnamed protein product [Bursaphelenchus okinawaensis]CAG9120430.1 unnamed protein product [Bursaphelenchus okinawaensis]
MLSKTSTYHLTCRLSSTLAERIAFAGSNAAKDSPEAENLRIESETDQDNAPFREIFLKPKRKLQSQLLIERMTGRAEEVKYSQVDIMDRIAVRTPRKEEMKFDQDWVSVWPAAQSFRSSVVPLPVRMGYCKMKNGRAIRPPFKSEGNLELVKIPNFLHLTPQHIQRHCEVLKQFCTEFPRELKDNESLVHQYYPITRQYSDYVHQGTSLRDIRARVIKIEIKLGDLNLSDRAKEKFRRLVGMRYNEDTDMFTLVTDRCFTRQQNQDYAEYLLTVLVNEAQKVEDWEKLKDRVDNLKVDFKGSKTEEKVFDILSLLKKDENPPSSAKAFDEEKKDSEELKKFSDVWYNYRNTPETPEAARDYGQAVRDMLGLPKVTPEDKNNVEYK